MQSYWKGPGTAVKTSDGAFVSSLKLLRWTTEGSLPAAGVIVSVLIGTGLNDVSLPATE